MGVLGKVPWDLRSRGKKDSNRHAQKIKQAIKKNLHNIIAEETIITSDGKRTTKVPVKYLDSYHFKHGYPQDKVGHGQGQKGDVLRPGKRRPGPGEAGNDPGADLYEAEISLDELTEMMLEDLGLPKLEEKEKQEIISKDTIFTDLRKKGLMSNWAKKRTIMENIKRNAMEGNGAVFGGLHNDDLRYRTWDEKIERHSNAVVYLMMDRSGSMDEHKRYLCKATFWWLVRFLEKRYDHVEIVFIAHDAEAKVVPEKDFFEISNDGGTVCSSAIELAWKDIRESRPANIWNVYCFHFSDGDNWGEDNERCVKLVTEMLPRINMFAYGEVAWQNNEWRSEGTLKGALGKIDSEKVMTTVLHEKADVYKALQKFLSQDMKEAKGK